jgi:hypothetical protein
MTGRSTTQDRNGVSRRTALRLVLLALVLASAAALVAVLLGDHLAQPAPGTPSGVVLARAVDVLAPEAVINGAASPAAPAVEDTSPIPPSVGAQGAGGFRVSLAGLPAGVSAERFVALAARSGRRWGLTYLGTTPSAPVSGDGMNVVGFGSTTIAGAGAETTSVPRSTTRTRRCARARVVKHVRVGRAHGARVVRRVLMVRRCRMVMAGRPGVEQDIVIDRAMPWQAGPAYPTSWQVDLETVLLHEFGHVARHGHVTGCVSSPMWASLSMGDWWRGIDDMRHAGC